MKKLNLIFLFFPLFILAQQQVVVKGTVLDEENKQLLPGVTILEKGTKNGAITDFDGFFEINTKLGATLSISYLGMKTQEIVVESETLKIYLQTNLDQLDEIVVTNTIPLSEEAKNCSKIRQVDLSSILAKTIRRFNGEESISSLFEEN